jgi:hypothetical protein
MYAFLVFSILDTDPKYYNLIDFTILTALDDTS